MIGYNGLDNLVWFVGFVARKKDPTKLGRIKVRALGFHPTVGEGFVHDKDLPWAYVMKPNSVMSGEMKVGDFVFGCFLDGRDAQQPLVLGVIGVNQFMIPTNVNQVPTNDTRHTQQNVVNPRYKNPADPERVANVVPPAELRNDPEFQAKLDEMIKKYPGLTEQEIYKVIQGESAFNTTAVSSAGATGLFQFMPATAEELGYTTAEIQGMSAAQQLQVYDEYLTRWNYNGTNSLGIMQAAPAYANRSADSVIYPVGSGAWNQNPGWRPAGGGDITVGSINDYYAKQGL